MMNRAGGPPPTWEYVASSILLLVTLWLAFKGAAKIFRIGILLTGKPPKMGEILKWLKAPVGAIPERKE
jgi:ABC-2 type transport system permease protein